MRELAELDELMRRPGTLAEPDEPVPLHRGPRHREDHVTYIIHGRCKSGSRWFWIAAELGRDEGHKCDDPVCIYGGPREYSWRDTEDLALKAMAEAVERLGGEDRRGCYKGNAPGRASEAAGALKPLNAAKRAVRPPSKDKNTGIVEYLYAAHSQAWVDDITGKRDEQVIPYQITKKTAKRIYYIRRPGTPEWNDPPVIAFISRQEFEGDSRVPWRQTGSLRTRFGNDHGDVPGEIRTNHYHDHEYHLFATRQAVEDYLFCWEREQERKRQEREPELKQLRREMAACHPDRGGTNEEFMEARKRYERALRRAS